MSFSIPSIRRRLERAIARVPLGSRKECVLCGRRVGSFIAFEGGWKNAPAVTRTLKIVGSDLDHYLCPACKCNDRERHLYFYMRGAGLFEKMKGKALLHFAPEPKLTGFVEKAGLAKHVKGDLFPSGPGIVKIDMLDVPFPDQTFDFIMANHVLEHVADDLKALSELRRVLRPDGFAILQTPYSEVAESTVSDASVTAAEKRLELYGQTDHVRLYGKDIFDRFKSVGFTSLVATHDESLPGVDPVRFGVNRREPFFLFKRV